MPLVPFSSVDRSALRWIRADGPANGFDLLAGDARVASIRWTPHAESTATLERSDGTWQLEHRGFLNPHIAVRGSPDGPRLARLSVHLGHHAIDVRGGGSYRFQRAGLLVPAWSVSGPDQRELVHLEPVRSGRTLEGGAVVVDPGAVDRADLLLLVVLAWYFVVLAWFEDETVATLEDAGVAV